MELWIGTSGYVYPEWVGTFYPRGTNSTKMLSYYADHFPLVELNFSYYQLPTQEQFARMLTRVPSSFQFIVKAHQSLTHDLSDESLDAFHASLEPMRQSGQLMSVLFQFPQRFHCEPASQRWISYLRKRLDADPLAVEFRHESWDRAHVVDWLRDEGITLVSVDVPDLPMIFPRKLVRTGKQIYLRLHSRRQSSWYAAGVDRYDYAYSDAELGEWVQAISNQAPEAEQTLVLFNNCRRTSAVINARQMTHLFSEGSDAVNIVAPFPSGVRQGVLFE